MIEYSKLKVLVIAMFSSFIVFQGHAQTLIASYPLVSNPMDATGNFDSMILENTPFQDGGIYSNGIYKYDSDPDYAHAITPYLDTFNFQSFSIRVLFKLAEFPADKLRPVFMGGNLYRWIGIYLDPDGTVSLKYNNNNIAKSTTPYSAGIWHEGVVTYDGTAGTLYLDGEKVVEAPFTIDHNNDANIGITDFSNGNTFKGFIAGLNIYEGIITPVHPSVTSFTLIDADTDQPISEFDPIPDGARLDLNRLPAKLNIRANTLGDVESVQFSFMDKEYHSTENVEPYALFGDWQGDYSKGSLPAGTHTLRATPWSRDGAHGDAGAPFGITFDVITESSFGPPRVVFTTSWGIPSIYSADLDGDNDFDVLAASDGDNKVAWFKNKDGLGRFGPENVITTDIYFPGDAIAADLDGDGDLDVIASSADTYSEIAWFENTDGLGAFGEKQLITDEVDLTEAIQAVDLDGDGDRDILAAIFLQERIVWYENTDGHGAFGPQQIIASRMGTPTSVFASDVDGDGDLDVLFTYETNDGFIASYENIDGEGVFTERQIIPITWAFDVHAADMDSDGDQDIVCITVLYEANDQIWWYENTDGLGTFESPRAFPVDGEVRSIQTPDIDSDGDTDILFALWQGGEVGWFENLDGLGDLGSEKTIEIIDGHARSVYTADLNGDGKLDILSSAGNEVVWFENLLPRPGSPITHLTLIDAETDRPLPNFDPLLNGATLNLDKLPAGLSVRANVLDDVKSVRFELLNESYSRVEYVGPFALFGDVAGDYTRGSFPPGEHVLRVTAYRKAGASEPYGLPLEVRFNVIGTLGAGKAEIPFGQTYEAYDAPTVRSEIPGEYALSSNFPNPFNPSTTISFYLPEQAEVRLIIYDTLGREIQRLVDGVRAAGIHEVMYSAGDLPSGTYLYRLDTPAGSFTRRMVLLK